MKDKEAYKKLIELVVEDSYTKEFELLQWLFRKLDEVEATERSTGNEHT